MKKLEIVHLENINGGINGTTCFLAGVGLFGYALGGVVGYTITAISGATAIKCWNS